MAALTVLSILDTGLGLLKGAAFPSKAERFQFSRDDVALRALRTALALAFLSGSTTMTKVAFSTFDRQKLLLTVATIRKKE